MTTLQETRAELVARVRNVPHLCIATGIDHATLAAEALAALSHAGVRPTRFEIDGFDSLKVAGVVDRERDPMASGRHYYPGTGPAKELTHEPTDLGVLMPRALAVLDSLTSIPGRVKLSIMQPGGWVEYHAHDDTSYVVHVPLVSNRGVRMLVRMDGIEYPQVYEPGTAWLFNSHHKHAVANDGETPRLHLWCNFTQVGRSGVNHRLAARIDAALQALRVAA